MGGWGGGRAGRCRQGPGPPPHSPTPAHQPTPPAPPWQILDKAAVQASGMAGTLTREVAILRRVRHPAVVQLKDVLATKDKADEGEGWSGGGMSRWFGV